MSTTQAPPMSYEDWGVAFFEHAVSDGRILGGISGLAGEPIEFGPLKVGPGRIASVVAHGRVGQPVAEQIGTYPVQFLVRLPVHVEFELHLAMDTHHYTADLEVPLVLTAVAVPPLTVHIEVKAPESKEIGIELTAGTLRASVVKEVADIKGEVRRFVAKYVAREVDKPHIAKARTIDVLALIGDVWTGIEPSASSH